MTQDVHMRETLKYTDYKQYHSTIRLIYQGQDVTDNSGAGQQPPAQQPPAQQTPTQQPPQPAKPQ
jgi:hypothetical protein